MAAVHCRPDVTGGGADQSRISSTASAGLPSRTPCGVTTIGRSPAADVELDDHRVAARHAAVVVRDARVVLVGRGAPVEVNGAAVDEAELRDGDHITIGATRLILVDHAPPA